MRKRRSMISQSFHGSSDNRALRPPSKIRTNFANKNKQQIQYKACGKNEYWNIKTEFLPDFQQHILQYITFKTRLILDKISYHRTNDYLIEKVKTFERSLYKVTKSNIYMIYKLRFRTQKGSVGLQDQLSIFVVNGFFLFSNIENINIQQTGELNVFNVLISN